MTLSRRKFGQFALLAPFLAKPLAAAALAEPLPLVAPTSLAVGMSGFFKQVYGDSVTSLVMGRGTVDYAALHEAMTKE